MSQNIHFGDYPFAIKEHLASWLHWDWRLPIFGQRVLSFASKFPPNLDPTRPLKIDRTNDHDRKYMFNEWIIPSGRPGSGPTAIWDKGVFRVLGEKSMIHQLAHGNLRIYVIGDRLKGNFSLKWIGPGEHNWLWIKEWDDYADSLLKFPNVLTQEKIMELERKNHTPKGSRSLNLFNKQKMFF
jgi:DNA ligase D-like protein (predicted 3'-phosphoesterase)